MVDEKRFKFVQGTQEKDLMEVVYCRAFGKNLKLENCNPDNCRHHEGVEEDKVERDGKIEIAARWVKCRYPQSVQIIAVCEA